MRDDTLAEKLTTARRDLRYVQNVLRTAPMSLWRIRNIAEAEEKRLAKWIAAAEAKSGPAERTR